MYPASRITRRVSRAYDAYLDAYHAYPQERRFVNRRTLLYRVFIGSREPVLSKWSIENERGNNQ